MVVDTVAQSHDLNPYLGTLRHDGVLVLVGLPPTPHAPVLANRLTNQRRSLAGSSIGGMRETEEMLAFCAEHAIACDIEMIQMAEINTAYERMLRSDVKYRFVIDLASWKA